MNCRECRKAIDETEEVTPDVSPEMREHLARCAKCRRRRTAAERLDQCIRDMRKMAESIPQSAVDEMRSRILAAVHAARQTPAPSRSRLRDLFDLPGWAWGMAAAVLVLLGYGGAIILAEHRDAQRKDRTEMERHRLAAVRASEEKAVPRPLAKAQQSVPQPQSKVTAPATLPATLPSLREEFARLKATDGGITKQFGDRLNRFASKGAQGLGEEIEARLLLVDTYEQAGERDLARAAFENYLDAVEQRDGVEKAARAATKKASAVFLDERDRLGGLAYYDMILTRYPDTREADEANYMVGRYYELTGESDKALEVYRRLSETRKGAYYGKRADSEIATVLYNMGKRDEAYKTLESSVVKYPADADWACFELGAMKKAEGLPGYPDASAAFRTLISKYPQSRHVAKAQRALAEINRMVAAQTGSGEL